MNCEELLRENKRMMDKSIREIERERQGLQTQEKKLIVEIKKNAKQGQMVLFFYLRYCGFVGREKDFLFHLFHLLIGFCGLLV